MKSALSRRKQCVRVPKSAAVESQVVHADSGSECEIDCVVAGDIGVSVGVAAALETIVLDFIGGMREGETVDFALFVCAMSCPRLERVLASAGHEFGPTHIAFVRDFVTTCTDARVAPSFLKSPAVAGKSAVGLLGDAWNERLSASDRAVAIHLLLRYFPRMLEEDRNVLPTRYRGYDYAVNYWQARLCALQVRGVELKHRVCCNMQATSAVELVKHGHAYTPGRVIAPVLPRMYRGLVSGKFAGESVHLSDREVNTCHGFRVVALPSDYLCVQCYAAFGVVDVAALTFAECVEWGARLQFVAFDDVGLARESLLLEQERLCKRVGAMECARRALASPRAQQTEFLCF